MSNLLIAGGTGFIGYHLALRYKKKGWKVTSISLTEPKKRRYIKGVKYLLIDLTRKNQISKILKGKFTHVVNLSGYTSNLYSKKFKRKIYDSHYLGTKNLIRFFKDKNLQNFVQIGSSAEYGNAKNPQKEKKKCKPLSLYGIAKYKASMYTLASVKKYKFPANVLRFFQVYGPSQGENRAVMQILKFCLNKESFPASDGKQIRDFCFIDDVIRAIDLTLKSNVTGKLINIASGKGVTMKKLILTIKKVSKGGEPQFGIFKSRNHENPYLVPSIDVAKKILSWNPKTTLEKGLRITKRSINGR